MALCRTPDQTVLIFSLPDCKLVHQIKLNDLGSVERPLEEDDLDQRFLMRNNTMMFMFHHPQFFLDEDDNVIMQPNQNPANITRRYGRLVFLDFTKFLSMANKIGKSQSNITTDKTVHHPQSSNDSLISMCVDSQFDSNEDYIEKISVISKERMVCVMSSGKILLRDMIKPDPHNPASCSHLDKLSIPCPAGLKLPFEDSDDSISEESDGNFYIQGFLLNTTRYTVPIVLILIFLHSCRHRWSNVVCLKRWRYCDGNASLQIWAQNTCI